MTGDHDEALRGRARAALRDAVAVVPHTDADGLAAGAIALRARGEDAGAAVLLGRGVTPWEGGGATLPDGPLAVLDWGVRELRRPALIVDHHDPERTPREDQVLITSEDDVPTAVLMHRIVPDAHAWVAAVGAVGDRGSDGFALVREPVPKTAVRRLTALVNAPRRLPDGPVRTALALLVDHESPQAALSDPRLAELEEAKAAWQAELERVVRTPPVVGPDVALLRFSSPCQVHPLVATTWARRLAPRAVVAANDGYLPGRVNFAMRGGTGSLLTLLRAALGEDAGGESGHGHHAATGGSLPPDAFDRVMARLGVPPAPGAATA